jgi:dTDP-4-dehydrorhamnose reductase
MSEKERVLVTGGSGLLGSELRKLLPSAFYPSHQEFDVADFALMSHYAESAKPTLVIHAAAFTSPPKVDENPQLAIDVNIVGTANVVKLCRSYGARLVYVSTDYVFDGSKGNYKETDPVNPVNRYAWSKLGGECAVRLYDNALIVRTSFGESEFPYEKAFVDQWTSRIPVAEFASRLVRLIEAGGTGVVHIGAPRRTVLEYAREISPEKEIGELSLADVSFVAPKDTSLDTTKYGTIVDR